MRHRQGRGVPVGYQEHWKYVGRWSEKKIAPGKWRFRFNAGKTRRSGHGGPQPGTRITWGFKNVQQRVIKTRAGHYETEMTGIKYLKHASIQKKRKRY